MVRFDSWRAVGLGNWPAETSRQSPRKGGRATWQAVTRVKLEQASKSPMWCRPGAKAGKAEWIRKSPAGEPATTITTKHGFNHRGSEHSMSGRQSASVGEARDGRRDRDRRTSSARMADHLGVGEGQRYPRGWVTPAEGRTLTSGHDCEGGKEW